LPSCGELPLLQKYQGTGVARGILARHLVDGWIRLFPVRCGEGSGGRWARVASSSGRCDEGLGGFHERFELGLAVVGEGSDTAFHDDEIHHSFHELPVVVVELVDELDFLD